MRSLLVPSLVLAALLSAGCGDNDHYLDLPEGCQPLLAGAQCTAPYPSDFYRVVDPSTATGFRIAPEGAARMVTRQGNSADMHGVAIDDGYSAIPSIVAMLPDDVAPDGLAPVASPEASLADDARTIIVAEDGTKIPHYVDIDPLANQADHKAIIIHPVVGLSYRTRYVVALRHVARTGGGDAAPAEGFRRLRDAEVAGDTQLEPLRAHYNDDIFPVLEKAGWHRGDIQLAWDFTVGSQDEAERDMLRVRELTLAWLDTHQPTVTVDAVEDDPETNVWRKVRGTITGPLFLESDQPGAQLARDRSGQVIQNGTTQFKFLVQIPASVRDQSGPGRALAYGHGFFGNTNEIEGGSARTISDTLHAVMFGIWWVGMSSDDIASVVTDLSGDPAHTLRFGDRVHQAMANWIVMASAIRGPLSQEDSLKRDNGDLVYAPDPVDFLGISQGAILGGTMTALNPFIDRVVLQVGGAGFTHMMFRARPFASFLLVLDPSFDDRVDEQIFAASMQRQFDRFDPGTYAHYLVKEPLAGMPADRRLLYQMGLGDVSVPNLGSFLEANLAGLPVTQPSPAAPYGLGMVTPPTDDPALTIYDFGIDLSVYDQATPATEDNPVHESVRLEPSALDQLDQFYGAGTIVHPCDGPCDPE